MVSGDHIEIDVGINEVPLCFGWRDVSDASEQAPIIEPVHPSQRFPFHRVRRFPRAQPVDDLCFEQPDDRLGQGIILAVSDGADRWLEARLGQPFGVAQRQILPSTIRMMGQAIAGAALVQGPLEGIEDELGLP